MLHPGLAWLQESEAGRAWLAALPRLVRECAAQWDLRLGPPFPYAYGWWAEGLTAQWEQAGRPFDRGLLDTALEALRTLPVSQGEQVLLHQDLHGENILRAQREPWLAIDPKPLRGEREFGAAPIIRAFEFGHGRRQVAYRLDRLTAELGLDRERARLWALAQTVAWAFGSDYFDRHIETARWLAEMGTG